MQLLGHGDLSVAGELAGRCNAALQFLAHLPELRGNRLHQMINLRVDGLALRQQGILHFLADGGELRLRMPGRGPDYGREGTDGNEAED